MKKKELEAELKQMTEWCYAFRCLSAGLYNLALSPGNIPSIQKKMLGGSTKEELMELARESFAEVSMDTMKEMFAKYCEE